MTDPKKFVANLKLPPYIRFKGVESGLNALESIEDGKPQAFVDHKSLISFVSAVSGQARKDILNSTLLAQRVADHHFPEDQDILKWYKRYMDVMTNIGWTYEQNDFSKYEADHNLFEMESAVVNILTAIVGQNLAVILTSTLDALKSLADDDGLLTAFEKNTHGLQKGHFQLGLAVQENDVVSLSMGAFLLETDSEIKKIVFFKSSKDSTQLDYYAQKCTLNDEIYSLVRNDILEKLGESTKDFIKKLPDLTLS